MVFTAFDKIINNYLIFRILQASLLYPSYISLMHL